jgi:8-oxo-dGTP pyrophosphatase MutT (NUDIX family)
MIFTDEVKNINELMMKLSEDEIEDGIKVAVVCFIFDKDGKLILQKRGAGARDDVGKLCAIGGSANFSDASFRDSLKREMIEEGGSEAVINIGNFIGAIKKESYDKNAGVFSNWIILAYMGTLESGELINTEPDRCDGFVKEYMENYIEEDLALTAKIVINHLLNRNKA